MSNSQRPYREGVGMMVLNHENKVLVGRRIDNDTEAWQMPQGGIDRGENPQQAAMRELMEEMGTDKVEIITETREWFYYDLPPSLANKLWNGRYAGQMQKWFLMRFLGTDADININTKIPEFAEWGWNDISTLPDLIVDFKRDLYRRVIEDFSSHLPK
jgi:putative (di)nucleoside polyphosphate hydrolase